ncbi:MAG TPA: tRNA pseudouridine(38-40) synthase TruA [Thiobacillaceae bacterium]|nr:tRNA pseudouridine(38-40) synthase TruA [Thiobacillaceae bacterium]
MRVAVGLEYDGRSFCGWQSQPSGCGVQDALERATAEIAGHPVSVIAAGRTDTGVHASYQVAHFDTLVERPLSAWVRGVNSHLPHGMAVLWSRTMPEAFHARFTVEERGYRYVLLNHPVRPGMMSGRIGWHHRSLDEKLMSQAAGLLLGRHDFSAFRAAECQASSPEKELRQAGVRRRGDHLVFDFRADGFLHHMVRNMVGALVHIGAGGADPEWMNELLNDKDRTRAAPTFMADGLYLSHIRYPAQFDLPSSGRLTWPCG